jgi:hypothetical protein
LQPYYGIQAFSAVPQPSSGALPRSDFAQSIQMQHIDKTGSSNDLASVTPNRKPFTTIFKPLCLRLNHLA